MNVDRVLLDGLTPSEYRSLVGSARNASRIRSSAKRISDLFWPIKAKSNLPEWILVLQDLIEVLQNSRTRYRSGLGVAENLAYPVVRHAWQKVNKMNGGLGRIMLSRAAKDSLRKSLLTRLSFTARSPAEWMWNVLRGSSGILIESPAETSERLLRELVFANGVEAMTLRLLEDYPALTRLWGVQVANWTHYIRTFVVHAKAFACNHLGWPTIIRKIEPDLSDPHSGNRSVMQVCFKGDHSWFYKPRSGKCEKTWFKLLDWLNERDFSVRFAIVKVVSCGDHCWMQAVEHRPCRSKKEAADYYFRAGALLLLVDWLRGVDFHAGNLIAHGSQPVIVDCETLFHPNITVPQNAKKEGRSILRTGMLPIWNSKMKPQDSVSALGRMTFGPHSVRIHGKTVSPTEFVDSIEDGFHTMHRFLFGRECRRRSGLAGVVKNLQQVRFRRLYTPTADYYRCLEQSLRVASLASGRARHKALCKAWRTRRRDRHNMSHEIQSLEDADIPIFHGKAAGLRRYSIRETNRAAAIIRRVFASTPTA